MTFRRWRRFRKLMEGRPLRRDLLIEHLHVVQDAYGHISAAHLAALAELMRLPQAEVFEVATFYHHFDVVKEGETPPPEITIRVCDSLSCALAGAETLIAALARAKPANVRVVHAPCMGLCDQAPAAAVGKNYLGAVNAAQLVKLAEAHETRPVVPEHQSYDAYCHGGGYETLKSLRAGAKTPDQVIEVLLEAGLRGLAAPASRRARNGSSYGPARGRAICASMATRASRDVQGPPLSADPAASVSRRHADRRLGSRGREGLHLSARRISGGAPNPQDRDRAHRARRAGCPWLYRSPARRRRLYMRRESAMIESVEGKRGLPRHRPPYVAQIGIFGRPTLVHNVETVYWMPEILAKGAAAFAALGKEGHKGIRSYSVSGRVKAPGVVVAPAGTTANELIERTGGMLDGHVFKGYLPGGASGGVLPASMADLPLDFGQLEKYGCFVGSHAVVILSDKDSMRDVAVNLLRFFEDNPAASARHAGSAARRRSSSWARRCGTSRCSANWPPRWRTPRSAASARRRPTRSGR